LPGSLQPRVGPPTAQCLIRRTRQPTDDWLGRPLAGNADTGQVLESGQGDKSIQLDAERIEYLEVTPPDIGLANRIAEWALGRSIDELAAPTRRLLVELYDWVRGEAARERLAVGDFTFTRRQAREGLGWNTTHLRTHLERLVQQELVAPLGRGRGRLHRYSLLYDGRGREGQPSSLGLVDPASLVQPVEPDL